MKVLSLFFILDEVLPLVIATAGICLIVGARQLAMGIISFVLASLFLPALLLPLVEMVPLWVLWGLFVYLLFLLPFFAISVLQLLVSPALGRKAASEMGGHLAADMTKLLLLAPFRILGFIAKTLIGLFRRRP